VTIFNSGALHCGIHHDAEFSSYPRGYSARLDDVGALNPEPEIAMLCEDRGGPILKRKAR
jgi:hypothetical protein